MSSSVEHPTPAPARAVRATREPTTFAIAGLQPGTGRSSSGDERTRVHGSAGVRMCGTFSPAGPRGGDGGARDAVARAGGRRDCSSLYMLGTAWGPRYSWRFMIGVWRRSRRHTSIIFRCGRRGTRPSAAPGRTWSSCTVVTAVLVNADRRDVLRSRCRHTKKSWPVRGAAGAGLAGGVRRMVGRRWGTTAARGMSLEYSDARGCPAVLRRRAVRHHVPGLTNRPADREIASSVLVVPPRPRQFLAFLWQADG
jgi:hypothetical protein